MTQGIAIEDQKQMLDDCIDRESKLTDWETNFIDSLYEWYDDNGTLTPKQCTKLEEVWERVTTNG